MRLKLQEIKIPAAGKLPPRRQEIFTHFQRQKGVFYAFKAFKEKLGNNGFNAAALLLRVAKRLNLS